MLPLFLSALFSIRSIRMKWPAPYITFSILLLSVFLVETMALLWKYYFFTIKGWPWSNSNLWLYNCFLLPQYLLYMAAYYQALQSAVVKRVIVVLAILFAVFAGFNMAFVQHIGSIDSYTLALADSIVIFLTIAWFEQLRTDHDIVELAEHPMSWISLGAFVYHAANLPYILILNYLIHKDVALAIALFYVYLVLNFGMYTLYTIAFLCKTPLKK
jgi:hypothetical protein